MALRETLRELMLIPGLAGYEGRVRRYLAAALDGSLKREDSIRAPVDLGN